MASGFSCATMRRCGLGRQILDKHRHRAAVVAGEPGSTAPAIEAETQLNTRLLSVSPEIARTVASLHLCFGERHGRAVPFRRWQLQWRVGARRALLLLIRAVACAPAAPWHSAQSDHRPLTSVGPP